MKKNNKIGWSTRKINDALNEKIAKTGRLRFSELIKIHEANDIEVLHKNK